MNLTVINLVFFSQDDEQVTKQDHCEDIVTLIIFLHSLNVQDIFLLATRDAFSVRRKHERLNIIN